jgi:hypothetical protein
MALKLSILSYLTCSSLFLVWHPSSFLKDLVVAPIAVAVPLGIGLLVHACCFRHTLASSPSDRLFRSVLCFYLGITAHTVLYQQLERLGILGQVYPYLYPIALLIAMYGLFAYLDEPASWSMRRMDRSDMFFLHLPLLAITYSFYYLKFSDFPLRDIFQEVHFMKGATELARFHVLNPYTADSYIPVLQVSLGLLHDWYGMDLLNAQWIMPVLFGLIRYATLVCLAEALLPGGMPQSIAIGLSILTFHNWFSPTNGDMTFSVCLLLISLMAKTMPRTQDRPYLWLTVLLGIAALAYKSSTVQTVGLYWVGAVFVLCLLRAYGLPPHIESTALLLVLTAVVLHPAVSLLYLTCALALVGLFSLVRNSWATTGGAVKAYLALALVTVTIWFGVMVVRLSWNVLSSEDSQPLWLGLAEWMLGKEITGAEGIRNTLIEWIRLAPPALLLILGLLAVCRCLDIRDREDRGKAPWWKAVLSRLSGMDSLTMFAWSGTLISLAIGFSGLPYAHRALYFPLLTICLLTALLLSSEIGLFYREKAKGILLRHGIMMVFYLAAVGRYAYKSPDFGGHSPISYIQGLVPFLIVAWLGSVVLLLTAFLGNNMKRTALLIVGVVFTGLLGDKFAMKAYGYRYTYGDAWAVGRPIAHYTAAEIELANRLRGLPATTILLSDPYTLGIVQAMTGLNALYTFSNLGVMRGDYQSYLRKLMLCLEGSAQRSDCGAADDMARHVARFIDLYPGAAPELRYVTEGVLERGLNAAELEDRLVIIVNAGRTSAWAEQRHAYFPTDEKFCEEYVERQRLRGYEIIDREQDVLLVLRMK